MLPGRRAFLRGLGATVALPGLSSMGVARAAAGARGVTATGAPLRMAYLCLPNGVIMDKWRPQGSGKDFVFNESMKSLEKFRSDVQILKGLEQATADELGLTKEELEVFMDGEDEEAAAAKVTSPVEALADLIVAQEDASAALADGSEELNELEQELADELGVSVEELEVVEDAAFCVESGEDMAFCEAMLPEGFEWGETF